MTPQQRKHLIEKVGKALYGERYGASLAAGMGVNQSLISRIMSGERSATDLQIEQLATFLAAEWQRQQDRTRLIEELIVEVTGEPLEQHPQLSQAAASEPESEIE